MREPCRRFTGRVEFLACKPEVVAQLKAGHSVRMIYDELKSQGKITIHYGTFWRYAVCIPGIVHKPLLPAGKRSHKAGGAPDTPDTPDTPEGIEAGPTLPALQSGGAGGAAPEAMLPALPGDGDFTPKVFLMGSAKTK